MINSSSNNLLKPLSVAPRQDAAGDYDPLPAPAQEITFPPNVLPDSTKKKTRGVKVISNGNYRIVPKKDSN